MWFETNASEPFFLLWRRETRPATSFHFRIRLKILESVSLSPTRAIGRFQDERNRAIRSPPLFTESLVMSDFDQPFGLFGPTE